MASPYESLEPGQTRILCLYPGEPGTPLHGHLEILQLDNMSSAKPYSAISYAWASHVLQYNIQLPDGTLLPITAALHGALQRFRHPSAEIRIWADAVCISQTDMEEKSAQILVIKDVFAQAHQILIWLGESAKSDSLVFMQLYRIRAGITRFNKGAELNEVIIANRSECYCCAEPVPVNTEEDNDIDPYSSGPVTRAALQDLLSRPWFTRLWVAQEVTAAVTSQIIILHCKSLPPTFSIHTHDYLSWLPSDPLAVIRRSHTPLPQHVLFELATHVRTSVSGYVRGSRRAARREQDAVVFKARLHNATR